MKKCLSPEDVMELSETQKGALRDLWQPNRYDLAAEIVWKDVENDLYQGVVFMVADVRAIATHTKYCEVVLKVLYLDKPPQYECLESEAEVDESDEDGSFDDTTEVDNMDGDLDIDPEDKEQVASTDHFLSRESCLPLFNIGQMIEILRKHQSELSISFTMGEAICYIDGREFSGDELCDALWEAVKTLL